VRPISRRPDPAVIEAAANWAVVLEGADVSAEDRDACAAWCAEHPDHRRTLEQLVRLNDALAPGGDGLEQVALGRLVERSETKRKRVWAASLGALALALVLVGGGVLWSMRDTSARFHTEIGEQRAIALRDGSRLILDTGGTAAVEMAGDARNVTLVKGQIFAEVAEGRDRPFVVTTPDGTITALGTAFVVRRQDRDTLVTVVESRVRICPAARVADKCRIIGSGQRARLTAAAVTPLADIAPDAAKLWTTGWIEADDRSVSELLSELNRYRPVPVRFDAKALADVRVSGSYPLHDTDYAIQGIVRSTGLRSERSPDGVLIIRR